MLTNIEKISNILAPLKKTTNKEKGGNQAINYSMD